MFPQLYTHEKLAADRRREMLTRAYRQPHRDEPGRSAPSWGARHLRQMMTSPARLGRRFGDQTGRTGWLRLGSVRLDVDLRNKTVQRADADGVSLAEITRRALRQYVGPSWAPGSPAAWHTEVTVPLPRTPPLPKVH
jgi:hypothetical protein